MSDFDDKTPGTSKGYQKKLFSEDTNEWIKFDSGRNLESHTEFIASELDKTLGWPVLEQKIWSGRVISKNWLFAGEQTVTFLDLLDVDTKPSWLDAFKASSYLIRYEMLCEVILSHGISQLSIDEYMKKLLTLDYILLNPDRHLNNVAFISNVSSGLRFTPMFDFGKGLGATLSPGVPLNSISAQPFSNSFTEQLSGLFGAVDLHFNHSSLLFLFESTPELVNSLVLEVFKSRLDALFAGNL